MRHKFIGGDYATESMLVSRSVLEKWAPLSLKTRVALINTILNIDIKLWKLCDVYQRHNVTLRAADYKYALPFRDGAYEQLNYDRRAYALQMTELE